MIEVKIILITVTFIQMWVDWVQSFPIKFIQRLRLSKLDFKPFNCTLCLSVWLGAILSGIMLDPIYLALPLFTKVTEKIIY